MARVRMTNFFIKDLMQSNSRLLGIACAQVNSSILDHWRKGLSPVMGGKKFIGYKTPKNYPAGKKPDRPVDLYGITSKSGNLYADLDYKISAGKAEIGFFTSRSAEIANYLLEGGYADPPRPRQIFPIASKGESLNSKIKLELLRTIKKEIGNMLKK